MEKLFDAEDDYLYLENKELISKVEKLELQLKLHSTIMEDLNRFMNENNNKNKIKKGYPTLYKVLLKLRKNVGRLER